MVFGALVGTDDVNGVDPQIGAEFFISAFPLALIRTAG